MDVGGRRVYYYVERRGVSEREGRETEEVVDSVFRALVVASIRLVFQRVEGLIRWLVSGVRYGLDLGICGRRREIEIEAYKV